jgi:hypothetical protein
MKNNIKRRKKIVTIEKYKGLLVISLYFIIRLFISTKYRVVSELIFFIAMTALIYIFYKVYRIAYENIGRLSVFIFLVMVLFPLSHYVIFKIDYKNYTFNKDYLEHKSREIDQELNFYNDLDSLLLVAKIIPKETLLNNNIKEIIGDTLKFKDYILVFKFENETEQYRSTPGDFVPIMEVYHHEFKIADLELYYDNISNSINKKKKDKTDLIKFRNNPFIKIHIGDLWLDSVTGFIFGNIKPISRISQTIQVLQIIIIFILVYIISSFLDVVTNIKIKAKK